jgi:uncharacterized membrane protein
MAAAYHQVTRLEGFSDAVFGFALTLLVVSLEVPDDADALIAQMKGFFGFALMFAMVVWIWYEHNWFFRRSGLQDPWTVFLNAVLLFVVLFYVYPLKFLTASLLYATFGIGPDAGPRLFEGTGGSAVLALYSLGVVLIFGTFVLLYRHANARRTSEAFSPAEQLQFRFARRSHVISLSLGVFSLALALASMASGVGWLALVGGVVYFLMGPLHGWNGYQLGKTLSALTADPAAVDRSGN